MRQIIQSAIQKRASLLTDETDAIRLVDGAGDGCPDLILETFADRWLVSTTSGRLPDAMRQWLIQQPNPCYWKQLDQHQKESPAHLSGPQVSEPFLIRENGIAYEISFQSGYSQGIFLDHRYNRAEVRRRMKPGMRLLNTFALAGRLKSGTATVLNGECFVAAEGAPMAQIRSVGEATALLMGFVREELRD